MNDRHGGKRERTADRTRLTFFSTRADFGWRGFFVRTFSAYCAANTNGTLTVVDPLEAGKRQLRTLLEIQLASPR